MKWLDKLKGKKDRGKNSCCNVQIKEIKEDKQPASKQVGEK